MAQFQTSKETLNEFEKTLNCQCKKSVHVLKAFIVLSHEIKRKVMGTIIIFVKCQTQTFYFGESNETGKPLALLTFPDLKLALEHFYRYIDYYQRLGRVFDDLDRLLKPKHVGLQSS